MPSPVSSNLAQDKGTFTPVGPEEAVAGTGVETELEVPYSSPHPDPDSKPSWRDAEGFGLIPNVSIEPLPHGEVILHTPQGDFQCKRSEILKTLTANVPLFLAIEQQAQNTLQAVQAIANLMSQLVTPFLAQHTFPTFPKSS